MISYLNNHTILGMMSERYKFISLNDSFSGFFKNSKNIVLFSAASQEKLTEYKSKGINKVFLSYLGEEDYKNFKSLGILHNKSKSTSVISVFNKDFFSLSGHQWREIRETRNKFDKIVTYFSEPARGTQEVLDLIKLWESQRGEVYGRFMHSGYDKNFFLNHWPREKENLFSNFFYIENRLVGYSIVSKEKDKNVDNLYKYVIRKVDTSLRNMCLYVDYKTFERIFNELGQEEFLIHWGASAGNVLKYKLKFPVDNKFPTYFVSINLGKI